MTKSSYILLLGIAIMIVIGAAVFWSTGGQENTLPIANQVATPITNPTSTSTSTVITATSSTSASSSSY